MFVGRLKLVMTGIMFLQEAFSQPTWEGYGTHLCVTTHSLRSPGLLNKWVSGPIKLFNTMNLMRCRHSLGAYTNIRYCSAGVYKDDAVRLKYLYPQLELDRCYI